MVRFLLSFFALLLITCPFADAKKRTTSKSRTVKERTVEEVKKERESTAREIRTTGKNITENKRLTQLQLDSLETIRRKNAEILSQIRELTERIETSQTYINSVSDSIGKIEQQAERLRNSYRASMRRTQGDRRASSKVTFIFSASSFREALQRIRYLRQFSAWQQRRAKEIKAITADLTARRDELEKLQATQRARVARLNEARQTLDRQEQQAQSILTKLRQHGSELQMVLKEKEQRSRELDRELDRLIAEEQARIDRERREQEAKNRAAREAKEKAEREARERARAQNNPVPQTPAAKPGTGTEKPQQPEIADNDRRLTGSFKDNKGQLLFPVNGSYRIVRGFGKQKHPDMPHVITENNGIDIETSAGNRARAVFSGKVASILQVQGYNYIVMVRHGDYLTVYSGLDQPLVRNGEEVSAGQALAPVMTDPERGGAGLLHFEIRYNSQKCNPLEWVH